MFIEEASLAVERVWNQKGNKWQLSLYAAPFDHARRKETSNMSGAAVIYEAVNVNGVCR